MAEVANMIYGLIGKVMAEVGAIGKDSEAKNYSGKKMYNFRGIDDVYNALNPVMAKYGIFIIPEVLEQTREERTSTNGGLLLYSILKVKFRFYAPDGSFVEAITIGEGMDSGDKASNKAMSIAMKYACFQVFMIPTEEMKNDDPDAQVHNVAPKGTAQAAQKASNPASVETSKKLPSQNPETPPAPTQSPVDTSTVKGFLLNEMAFMAQVLKITDKKLMMVKFEDFRKALVEHGAIKDIKASEMTMEEARELVAAIRANFLPKE